MQLLVLLGLLWARLVEVGATTDTSLASANVLNDASGRTPCEMEQNFLNNCSYTNWTSQRRDTISITPCTCTNVFFNLYSACEFIRTNLDNTTLPDCGPLVQNCTTQSLNITNWHNNASLGYPSWAFMKMPSNGTFDVAAAIEAATPPSHKWTLVQILVPVIVGLAVAVVLIFAFLLVRRRRRANRNRPWMNNGRFHFPSLHHITKVREANRSESWSIEERDEPFQEYQFVSHPNSMQGSQSSHVRLSSSSAGIHPPPLKVDTAPVRAMPGRSLWSQVQRAFITLPLPWRTLRPVKNVGSYEGFRVGDEDSDSPLSQRTHDGPLGRGRGPSSLRNETVFEEDESDSDRETEGLLVIGPDRDAVAPVNPSNLLRSPPQTLNPLPLVQPAISSPPSTMRTNATARTNRSIPAFPPAPTSPPPPPPPPTMSRSVPRTGPPPTPIPPPPPPIPSPPTTRRPAPIQPPPPLNRAHQRSDSASVRTVPSPRGPNVHARNNSDSSSIRSLPMTPTPPYMRAPPPTQPLMSPPPDTMTPPNSAPPYVQRPSLDLSHSPEIPGPTRLRRLPQPPR